MITFTAGLLLTFLIGYFVVKGLLGIGTGIIDGIKKLFKKG